MSTILSIYAGPHDAAICILKNGKVLINFEKERFSRIRYDGGFSKKLFEDIFERIELDLKDIDHIVIDGKVKGEIPAIVKNTKGIPWNDIIKLKSKMIFEGECEFFSKKLPLFSVHHHLSHAAGAYFTSPFKDATILTADSGGMGYNYSLSIAKDGYLFPQSFSWTTPLGWWWARLPLYYGVINPGTLMAISGYGKENNLLKNELLSQMFVNSSKKLDKQNINLGLDVNKNGVPITLLNPKIKGDADLAYALQSITDDIFSGWFNQAKKYGSKNLCFSGGLALNCIGNTRAAKHVGIEKIHVPPNPNDCGLALGAALALHYYYYKKKYIPKYFSPYNGIKYTKEEIDSVIKKAKKNNKSLLITKVDNERIVNLLSKGHIIARFFKQSESGPRALGNRSFIASPDIPNLRNIMNEVKNREWYRPFAPIILKKEAVNLFENVLYDSYYMNTSAVIKKKWRKKLSGVMHIDHSTRPQLIDENSCSDLYEIVNNFFKQTAIPGILNTSFNINEPLVETPEDAMRTFLNIKKHVNFLQLDNLLIEKK